MTAAPTLNQIHSRFFFRGTATETSDMRTDPQLLPVKEIEAKGTTIHVALPHSHIHWRVVRCDLPVGSKFLNFLLEP
jgi:hypothetical protein